LKMSYLQDDLLENLENLFSVDEIKFYANGSKEILGNERIEALCKRYNMQHNDFPNYIENIEDYFSK